MKRHPQGTRLLTRSLIRIGATLVALLAVASVVGCQQQPQPVTPSKGPTTLVIMVESNIVEAGSYFVVSGSNFKPHQKVWVNFEYRASDRTEGIQVYCEADENGSINPTIDIPEDVVPGDYEVKIYTGSSLNIKDRQLLTTLPIYIQAVK